MDLSKKPLAIVAAVGRNGAIGRDGRLPWTLPTDLARFRALTIGKPMIMGRATFQSIGRVLPGRETIVVSADEGFAVPSGAQRAFDLETAVRLAQTAADRLGADEISVIGGANIFAALLPAASRLYVTRVDLRPEADVFFPAIDETEWEETRREVPHRDPRDETTCLFIDYRRRSHPVSSVAPSDMSRGQD